MKTFRLTYDVVTEASARNGDAAHRGFVPRSLSIPVRKSNFPKKPALFNLRESVDFLLSRSSPGPVESDSCPLSASNPPRWFTYGGAFDREHNGYVTVSLHLPEKVTPSSALRVARLLRCYGI